MTNRTVTRAGPVVARDSSCRGYVAGLRVRIYRPPAHRAAPPLAIYLHPGRFMAGDIDEADATGRALAARLGVAVVAPAYSLATERPFPAAAEDAYAALAWGQACATHGEWNARHIAVIGEEAGGNLAAVVAMMARDRGGPALAAQVLIAPMLDPSLSSCSMRAAEANATHCDEAYQRYLPHAA